MRGVVILVEAAEDIEAARDFYDLQQVGFGRNWPGAERKNLPEFSSSANRILALRVAFEKMRVQFYGTR